jgi:predicted AlkP superfamily phosphohydrolase/phosphomutase
MLRDLLPKNFRKSLARMLPTALRDQLAKRVDTADMDWTRTRVYWLPTDLEGYLRVNLRGREPQGIVEPGAEYEQVLTELEAALRELRDPATGEAIVADVIRTDTAFPGARRDWLPDLIVRWNGARPITVAESPRIGRVESPSPDTRPGTHTGPGFVLAAGAGIAAGAELQGADILDFAPTLLRRLDVAPPATLNGHVWPQLTMD